MKKKKMVNDRKRGAKKVGSYELVNVDWYLLTHTISRKVWKSSVKKQGLYEP